MSERALSKVPHVAVGFWIAKILATTLGETGADALSMGEAGDEPGAVPLGYAKTALILLGFFALALTGQLIARRYIPIAYWLVVVATTLVGTALSDFLDRTCGMGYAWSSLAEFLAVLAVLGAWRASFGRVAFEDISSRREELFYWLAILFANTLGTALGDYAADAGLGFAGGAAVFAALIAVVAAARVFVRRIPASALFWSAYVLTRPLGATLGDVVTKPHDEGGLALSRMGATAVIAGALVVAVALTRWHERRTGRAA